ncbi:hypothetical protein L6452_17326 [Arctium lappa]|uniref:Uncharacterized protein n=1 Tax=Arctium lappa TaxID=4217 RepID=A0ACB9C395_ARCLA|nr:hypothetical protein L6452_17326 [Arctium lappa]
MVKASSYFDKNGVKKGAWSEDEDNKLRAYIQRYGHWNWGLLPKFAGVSRSGKSCRLRWMNYLRPNMKHGNFTKEEDDLVIDLHKKLGNKWSAIASKLPGRSDNEIKNRWNTHLKKRAHVISDHQTVAENEHIGTLESDQANVNENPVKETDVELDLQEVESLFAGILSDQESPSFSSSRTELSSYPDYAVLCDLSPQTFEDELVGNFWTAPFLRDNDSIGPSCDNLLSTFNFVNDFISHPPSCQDMMMSDEFLWSTLDTFVDDNMDFIN